MPKSQASVSPSQSQRYTLDSLRRPSPHFQRAVNLKYDLGNADYIAAYLPTPNAVKGLAALLSATQSESNQRAHVLYGAYGSGKSLFAAVVAALLSRDRTLYPALYQVVGRLRRDFPETAGPVAAHLDEGVRLLPIVLSGDEGELSLALGRALERALANAQLSDIHPQTVYRAAQDTILLWRDSYPTTYEHLTVWLEERGQTQQELASALEEYQPWAYQLFLECYPTLTAGATFDRHNGQPIVDVYRQSAGELRKAGYAGIAVFWDEFGRFVEGRVGEPTGPDAALLQDFAEACNRSGSGQMHLILIPHRELGQYARHLPPEYQQEWERIAGRFRQIDISGDPETDYRLVAEALTVADTEAWAAFLEAQRGTMSHLLEQVFELGLFRLLTEDRIRELVLEGAYPLHPLTTHCLPRLSNRVAQNERTLFTFMAAEEPDALGAHLARTAPGIPGALVRLDYLWDYFAGAVRADVGTGGAHSVWANVEAALRKAPDHESLAAQLIKSLGVLTTVGNVDGIQPTTEMLCFAVGAEDREGRRAVEQQLRYLARRKALIFNQIDGSWEFFSGSSVDLEAILEEMREARLLRPPQRRQLLERILPPRHYRARRFNQEHGMTRFFWSLYRAPQELAGVDWGAALRETRIDGQLWGYADGFVVYVLAADAAELHQASAFAEAVTNAQVLVVVPHRPLSLEQPLTEWSTLDELNHDARFKEQDPERLQWELDYYLSEATARLEQALAPLIRPEIGGADWYYQGQAVPAVPRSDAQVGRLLSDICDEVFSRTPLLSNELLNKRWPTAVQVRAAERVIDALFSEQLTGDLGLPGNGPEVMAVKTILHSPGLLRLSGGEQWEIGPPDSDRALASAWDETEQFFLQAGTGPKPFEDLLHALQSPPYGMRLGVLPLLIAAAMRSYLRAATVRQGQRVVVPLAGAIFTDLCLHPEQYTVEVNPWDMRQEAMWQVLEERFGGQVLAEERRHQPLNYLSLGMLRWLQSQPRCARDTQRISEEARRLRSIIRQAHTDPAKVLFKDLPDLLDDGSVVDDSSDWHELLKRQLARLVDEIAAAPQELQHRLDRLAVAHFASDSPIPCWDGRSALSYWLAGLEQQAGTTLETLRFGEERADNLVHAIRENGSAEVSFWDQVAHHIIGLPLRDWNDHSEETFIAQLLATKERVEHEVPGLAGTEDFIQLEIKMQSGELRAYRFRPSELSVQGQRILQNFTSTLRVAGRPLTLDERRQIVLALLHHVMDVADV